MTLPTAPAAPTTMSGWIWMRSLQLPNRTSIPLVQHPSAGALRARALSPSLFRALELVLASPRQITHIPYGTARIAPRK